MISAGTEQSGVAPAETGASETGATGGGPLRLADVPGLFSGEVRPVRVSLAYRISLLVVAALMVTLPLIYLAIIAGLGWLVYYHAVHHIGIFSRPGSIQLKALVYVGPILGGVITILFMIKPLFAPAAHRPQRLEITRLREPVLFAFIDQICDLLRAPRPSVVYADCRVNASAGFRRGMMSFFSNDLALTIGLPLAAGMSARQFGGVLAHEFGHFSQGAAMRLYYLIESVNTWFERVVHERDEWDEKLQDAAEEAEGLVYPLVQFCALMVWVSRRILAGLMLTGRVFSFALSRQMEFDADRCEARISGSSAFDVTDRVLHELGAAAGWANRTCSESFAKGELPDDMSGLVAERRRSFTESTRSALDSGRMAAATRMFDTHPSTADRVASVMRDNAPGVLLTELPALALFQDFDALSKKATLFHYQAVLGEEIDGQQLVSLDHTLRDERARDEILREGAAYFQSLSSFGPDRLRDGVREAEEAVRAVPADRLAARLAELRDSVAGMLDDFLRAGTAAGENQGRLMDAAAAEFLFDAGVPADLFSEELKIQSPAHMAHVREKGLARREELIARMARPRAVMCERLAIALRLLADPGGSAAPPDREKLEAEARELLGVIHALAEELESIRTLQDLFNRARIGASLLAAVDDPARKPKVPPLPDLQRACAGIEADIDARIGAIASGVLSRTRNPIGEAPDAAKISDILLPGDEDSGARGARVAQALLSETWRLFGGYSFVSSRCTARLGQIAARVESALGMDPLPAPPPGAD